jgi:hypothetical protein
MPMNAEAAAPPDVDAPARFGCVLAASGRNDALVMGHDGIDPAGRTAMRRFSS